jgi:hypothetical protein
LISHALQFISYDVVNTIQGREVRVITTTGQRHTLVVTAG